MQLLTNWGGSPVLYEGAILGCYKVLFVVTGYMGMSSGGSHQISCVYCKSDNK